ncbi:MAG: hypothetical protein PHV59_02750 [Victivallales bacterium]|nr:hypothetical protein [Victivallales bacterium]
MRTVKLFKTKQIVKIISITLLLIIVFSIGAYFYRSQLFPFPQMSYIKNYMYLKLTKETSEENNVNNNFKATIPCQYSGYCLNRKNRKEILSIKEYSKNITCQCSELALVLVDTWDQGKNKISLIRNRQKNFLQKCREAGVTIIYANNLLNSSGYIQYRKLTAEMRINHIKKTNQIPRYRLNKNKYSDFARKLRIEAKRPYYYIHRLDNIKNRSISRFLKPELGDYIVNTFDEFMYVLHKNHIKIIMYMGGSINECMLHRDTGINILAGSDNYNMNYLIILIEDCIKAIRTENFDKETIKKVFLDYLKKKIAFISNSKDIIFKK